MAVRLVIAVIPLGLVGFERSRHNTTVLSKKLFADPEAGLFDVKPDVFPAETGQFARDPMIPHTFVLEPGLKIFKVYNGYWYWGRPTMAELLVNLRAVFQKIRPDFDLAAPGLKEAWETGDRNRFLVDTLEEPIRYTEGNTIGIKR